MRKLQADELVIGTVTTLKPFRRVDSRACIRCGAVAGRCEHLQPDEDIVWLNPKDKVTGGSVHAWNVQERARVRSLFECGYTYGEIAEALNTTRSAVAGILRREGVRRG